MMPARSLPIFAIATLLLLAPRWAASQSIVASPIPVPHPAILELRHGTPAPASPESAPPLSRDEDRRARSSLGRRVAWGAAIGAAAGVVAGLTIRGMCDSHCEDIRARGLVLQAATGAVLGGAIGVLIHRVQERMPDAA